MKFLRNMTIFIFLYTTMFNSLPVGFSQEKKVGFSFNLATETGFSWGSVEELVYQEGRQISRLVWDVRWVPSLGIKGVLKYCWLIGIIEASTAFPIRSGALKDFDYLLEDPTKPSHYSWHEAYLDKDMCLGFSLGLQLPLGEIWVLVPRVGVTYQNRKWSGQNGYLQYPNTGYWTGNESQQSVAGTVISYEQALWYPSLSLAVEWLISSPIGLSVLATWIPYLEIQALDNHFIRNPPVQFYDRLLNGMGIEGEVKLFWYNEEKYISKESWYMKLAFRSFSVMGTTSSRTIGLGDGTFIRDSSYTAGSREIICFLTIGFLK
ncbi:MAG: omptin family outer membrane protease [Treponemataceae bacterium]|nr:omptin family outer membrane protease [Treponemataceae bacterium]